MVAVNDSYAHEASSLCQAQGNSCASASTVFVVQVLLRVPNRIWCRRRIMEESSHLREWLMTIHPAEPALHDAGAEWPVVA